VEKINVIEIPIEKEKIINIEKPVLRIIDRIVEVPYI